MLQTRLSRSPPRGVGQGAPRTLAGVRSPPPAAPEMDADGGLDPSDQTPAPSP